MGYLDDSLLSLFARKVGFVYERGQHLVAVLGLLCGGFCSCGGGLESSGSVVVAHGIVFTVCGLLLVGLATSQYVGP